VTKRGYTGKGTKNGLGGWETNGPRAHPNHAQPLDNKTRGTDQKGEKKLWEGKPEPKPMGESQRQVFFVFVKPKKKKEKTKQ